MIRNTHTIPEQALSAQTGGGGRSANGLTVRARILSISLITAVGLLVVGAAFWWSQSKVEDAFRASEANTNLARAAYDFAGIAKQMQIEEKLYLSAPSAAVFDSFKAEAAKAEAGIAGIAAMPAAKPLANETADVQDTVSAIGGAFAELHAIQEKIGFDGSSGLRADLTVLADKAKNRINDELKFGGASDFEKLVRTVMEVQLAERKFTLSGGGPREEFDEAFAMYTKMLGRAYIPNEVKAEIETSMTGYKSAFDAYADALVVRSDKITLVEDLFMLLPPHIEALISAARAGDAEAAAQLADVRQLSSLVVYGIILAMLVGLPALAFAIGRSVSGPLTRLQTSMERLASGQTDVELPQSNSRDEIAAMVRTVRVFRDNAAERIRLEAAQAEENAARDERVRRLEAIIGTFEQTVQRALDSLDAASKDLGQASSAVEHASDEVAAQAGNAGQSVRVAAQNVTSAAGATEELAASIKEIANQADRSTKVAKQAVAGAESTFSTMQALSSAADRIGAVMSLIRDIANQTNLLALNATIEAARAGEAGKGFAVVAAEVKQLANQTSKATEDIAAQVEAIQNASAGAVTAISEVRDIISDMDNLAVAVAAAVEQQEAAVSGIAANVADASSRSEEGAERMSAVVSATQHARSSGDEVDRLSQLLSEQAGVLRKEIRSFLEGVRAA